MALLAIGLIVRAVLRNTLGNPDNEISLSDRPTFIRMVLFAALMVSLCGGFRERGVYPLHTGRLRGGPVPFRRVSHLGPYSPALHRDGRRLLRLHHIFECMAAVIG
ncbi:hypothetical protein [Breoghania sp.]|uniref:hypothetical protein n=1 Tax=Breoghania sp. TaxID=2065378 RepID=UPI00260E28C0|nr:hypothetical protein [Breoghania sp.]MDJ0930370.1 hypothetical protein [Breoghania sp.]